MLSTLRYRSDKSVSVSSRTDDGFRWWAFLQEKRSVFQLQQKQSGEEWRGGSYSYRWPPCAPIILCTLLADAAFPWDKADGRRQTCSGEERWTVKSMRGLQRTDLTVYFNVVPSASVEFLTGCDVLKHNEQKMAKVLFSFHHPSGKNEFQREFNIEFQFAIQYWERKKATSMA